ncbi:MAG: C_GCAxxG_C_C family protein [Ruminiclostridium sp.]|nr:C_GCAxxG_C_C family protein [Ruminiclostridium sp.]
MSERGDRAKELFRQGYNCAQAVVLAFSDMTGLDEKTSAMLASGFGGGMGRMREVCGAVSGMFIVYNMLNGYSDPADNEGKMRNYADIQKLAADFKAENGSIICKELLGLSKPEGTHIPEKRTDEYYKKRPCGDLVKIATEVLEEFLGNKD